jgi:RNA polymerase sigma-70 factor (ECF subfamily)
MPEVPTMATPQCDELAAILDAELQAIPEKYRIPVVLCHLRDLTVAQAASELGWPVGTVASRLSRGRQWLAKRLLRRGITGAAGIFTTLWLPSVNAAPLALVREATHIALSDGASPLIHSLAEEVVSMMTVSSMRLIVAGMVACAGLALLGGGQLLNTTIAAPIPAAKALKDAKSNLDRVKLENPAEFLKIEAIRKELGLDDAIYKELQEFYDEKTKEFADEMKRQFMAEIQQQGLQPFPGLNLDFGNTQLMPGSKAEEEYIKKVNEKLKPEQLQRLKQLQLQMRPFNIFLDRIVIRELQLTAKQEDQLAELTKVDATTAMMFGNDPVQLANQTDDPKVWEAALNVLTDDQRKRWDAFIGKKIDAELLAELKRARNQLPFGIELGGAPPVIVGGAVPPPPPPVQPEGNPPPDSQ